MDGQQGLRFFLKNIRSVVKARIAADKSYAVKVVVGNQGCDPDSVVGSVLVSVLKFIEKAKQQSTFHSEITALMSADFTLEKQPILQSIDLTLPLINNETNNFVRDKADLEYLDKTFHLGLEEITPVSWLQELEVSNTPVQIILYDHNSPEKNLKKYAPSANYVEIIDHHAVTDQAFVDSVPLKDIQKSGSAFSVALRGVAEENIVLLFKYFPTLAEVSSVVILADSNNFKEDVKNVRWCDYDETIFKSLGRIHGLEKKQISYYKKAMSYSQYSMDQFKKPLGHLLEQDQKTFDYVVNSSTEESTLKHGDKIEIVFATMRSSIENYIIHFKEQGLREAARNYIEKEKAHAAIFMFLAPSDDDKEKKRDMLIYSKDRAFARKIGDSFKQQGMAVDFVQEHKGEADDQVVGYQYVNPKSDLSRKIAEAVIRPLI